MTAEVKHTHIGEEAEGYRQDRGPVWSAIFDTLRGHTMSNMVYDDLDCAYPLVDLMSTEGKSIATGEWEMVILADDINAAIARATGAS